ncbi:MAG: DUF1015 domain-containing protein [Anaerolineae bacterium]|nr:DUF1015 domain-containing protein [Anaerolineae bacterium]
MAVVKPFRGIRYNTRRIPALQTVISQPYDRIDDDLQQQYYDLSPYNIVRIIQGKTHDDDQPTGPNVYTRARDYYQQWQAENVLVRENTPAFYAYEQTFTVENETYIRLGMIAAVELTDFDEGTILPHERTHAGPKEDRLRLLRTIQANTEQIFILYPDAENTINALIRQAIANHDPAIDVVEIWENDVRQRLWPITDPAILAAIQAEMAPKRGLIIADGHHRYGTGLNYRDEQSAAYPDAPANAAFNFVQATLVSMDDPGLVVLPTHREICNFAGKTPAEILKQAAAYFAITPVSNLETCLDAVNQAGHTFGFYGGAGFYVLTLKNTADLDALIPDDQSDDWKNLAVSVLHKLILEQIAGVPVAGIEDKSMIRYHRDAALAVRNIDAGQGNFVFFVSPTRMEQIKAVAGQGEKMPQKSTDFYPKVISGLSMLPLAPEERL